ncbi:MAG: L,D-transpeptidase, partial [Ruminococcus sp.]|nr:L,D-transpeptidase [Ruminococcus sp.]
VEISIKQQYMWLYIDRKLVCETDVVTGNDDGYCNTPTGYFSITSRARNTYLNGPGYSSFVNYWMGFYGGCGIHDASWRSSYGGNIYKGNGSHGCVNTPYSKVQKIYNNTGYGTPVIVYD